MRVQMLGKFRETRGRSGAKVWTVCAVGFRRTWAQERVQRERDEQRDERKKPKQSIKSNKHPGWDMVSPNTISDAEKERFKFFRPQYLSAIKWSPDEIELTLEKYFNDDENDSSAVDMLLSDVYFVFLQEGISTIISSSSSSS